MTLVMLRGEADTMSCVSAISCLVRPSNSAAATAVQFGLRAAGVKVISVSTAYDAVVEVERLGGRLRHLILGVDFFGRDELRIIPLARREWPEMMIVAYHSPGFEHKGRLAELVGADLVLGTPDQIANFMESLAPSLPASSAGPHAVMAGAGLFAAAPRIERTAPHVVEDVIEPAAEPAVTDFAAEAAEFVEEPDVSDLVEEAVESAEAAEELPSLDFAEEPVELTPDTAAGLDEPDSSEVTPAAAPADAARDVSGRKPPSALESVEVQRALAAAARPDNGKFDSRPAPASRRNSEHNTRAPAPAEPAMAESKAEPPAEGNFAGDSDLSRIELTEEEIRVLLGEDGDDRRSRGQP
jgi:hypothetical protein